MSWLSSNHGTNTTPRGHAVATARLEPRANGAASRLHLHLVAAANIQLCRIVGMHEADGVRKRAIELGHAPGH